MGLSYVGEGELSLVTYKAALGVLDIIKKFQIKSTSYHAQNTRHTVKFWD